jgi:hypothetical protein
MLKNRTSSIFPDLLIRLAPEGGGLGKTGCWQPECPSSRGSEGQFYQKIARIRTTSGNLGRFSGIVSQRAFSYPIQAHAERYQVHVLVLNHQYGEAIDTLAAGGWTFIHLDDWYTMPVRGSKARQAPAYRLIRPCTPPAVTPLNAQGVWRESTQALTQCPEHATFAHAWQAAASRVQPLRLRD